MLLTDYYYFKHLPDSKSKSRYDCVNSTANYIPLESLRNKAGDLFIYYSDVPECFNQRAKNKADKIISKTKSISSIFVPDVTLPYAYGDIQGTSDGLLIVSNPNYSVLELFIARGQKNNKRNLYTLLADGELIDEIEYFRESSKVAE